MSWIQTIADGIEKAFDTVRPALKSIPPFLLICELYKRPGLSAIALTSAIIRRLPEAGIETGVNPDGSENKVNQFVRIMCEETIKEIKDKPYFSDEKHISYFEFNGFIASFVTENIQFFYT